MLTKDRLASDASYGPTFKEVRSKRKRDMVFGSNFNPLQSSQASRYATLTITIVLCLTWCFMQSTHLFPLKVLLQLFCSSKLEGP